MAGRDNLAPPDWGALTVFVSHVAFVAVVAPGPSHAIAASVAMARVRDGTHAHACGAAVELGLVMPWMTTLRRERAG